MTDPKLPTCQGCGRRPYAREDAEHAMFSYEYFASCPECGDRLCPECLAEHEAMLEEEPT